MVGPPARQWSGFSHSYLVNVMTAIRAAAEVCLAGEQCLIVYFHSHERWQMSFAIGNSVSTNNTIVDNYFYTLYKVIVIEEQNIGIACFKCFQYNGLTTDREKTKHLWVRYDNFCKGRTEYLPFRVRRKQSLFSWYVVTRPLYAAALLWFWGNRFSGRPRGKRFFVGVRDCSRLSLRLINVDGHGHDLEGRAGIWLHWPSTGWGGHDLKGVGIDG